jgi:cell wall-associated NlpC family hydrolase
VKQLLTSCLILLTSTLSAQENWENKADSIVSIAKEQLGVTYKYATSKPNISFDCSGFTSYVYNSCEIPSSRSSKAYKNLGEPVSLAECRKGDCILFTGTDASKKVIGHVGIVLENSENGIKFIHCSSSKKHYGVTITDFYDSGYPKRFMEVRRLFE